MKIKNYKHLDIPEAGFFIDITDQVCPLTFVKIKLLIESMPIGGVAEIRLKGEEALENVPRSIEEHGHLIFALSPEDSDSSADKPHRLIVRKN